MQASTKMPITPSQKKTLYTMNFKKDIDLKINRLFIVIFVQYSHSEEIDITQYDENTG